jgi:hypothetical protein
LAYRFTGADGENQPPDSSVPWIKRRGKVIPYNGKINGDDPYTWPKLTLERLAAGRLNRDLDVPMPWNYQAQN